MGDKSTPLTDALWNEADTEIPAESDALIADRAWEYVIKFREHARSLERKLFYLTGMQKGNLHVHRWTPSWVDQKIVKETCYECGTERSVDQIRLETLERELADCRAELERGRDAQIQAETLAQLLGAAILRLKELGEKSWELPPHAKRLASPAEREGADELARHLDGEHHAIVAQQIDSPMNACSLKPTCLWLKKLAASQPAPSAASGLDVPVKPDLEWLRKVAALVPNLDGTEDMTQVVRAIHGAILAVSPALRSRPAQGDCLHDFEYFTNAAGTTPFERCRKCGTSRSL